MSGLASPPAGPAWSPVSAITWLRDAEEVTPFLSPCSHLGKNQGQQLPCPASPSRGPGESVDEEVLCQPSRWHVKILMVSFIYEQKWYQRNIKKSLKGKEEPFTYNSTTST